MIDQIYDAVVIGGGPAGLTAALYLSRAYSRVAVIEKDTAGGQITSTSEVVNYPGVEFATGQELGQIMRRQAENFGAEFISAEVQELDLDGDIKNIKTNMGDFESYTVILATGSNPRKAGFAGEEKFTGRGVGYCATCDGEFFTGQNVFVIGGGYAAAEESVFLSKYASHVDLFIRGDDFTCARAVAEPTLNNDKITVHYNTQVMEVRGENQIKEVVVKDLETGEDRVYKAGDGYYGVFVFAGNIPENELFKDKVALDDYGYILTNDRQETNIPGVYGAGDICSKELRQVVTATADGAIAADSAEKYSIIMQAEVGRIPTFIPPGKSDEEIEDIKEENQVEEPGKVLNQEIKEQLVQIFGYGKGDYVFNVYQDDRQVSQDLAKMIGEMAEVADNFTMKLIDQDSGLSEVDFSERPLVRLTDGNGKELGVNFHGVPGGQEFQAFVLGIYNAISEGQEISPVARETIGKLGPIKVQIGVSQSCSNCPDLVTAAQRIATLNQDVKVDIYDLASFDDLKTKYDIMSVPAIIINDGQEIAFGKKSVDELAEILANI